MVTVNSFRSVVLVRKRISPMLDLVPSSEAEVCLTVGERALSDDKSQEEYLTPA